MTVSVNNPVVAYLEDGVTLTFAVPWRYLDTADLVVDRFDASMNRTTLVLGVGYTATTGDSVSGGSITLAASVAGMTLRIKRATARKQGTDYATNDSFPAESHERALDRLTLLVQEQDASRADLEGRTLHVSDGDVMPVLPKPSLRAGLTPGFDEAGALVLRDAAALAAVVAPALPSYIKGDPGGNVMAIGLFAAFAGFPIAMGTDAVQTTGHSAAGSGPALYLADGTADAALAAAYPNCCKASSNGRYFRLLPDADGLILISAAGVAGTDAVDNSVNHQPGIQQALDYALAIGAKGVRFDKAYYSVWTPLRGNTVNNRNPETATARTGFPLKIYGRQELHAAPCGTTLVRRKNDGSDPNVFAGTQYVSGGAVVTPYYWRGGMFLLVGVGSYTLESRPADYDSMATLILRGKWTLSGGLPRSATPGLLPADALGVDGSAWDITDRAIWCQNDRHTGDLIFDDLTIDGFRGELIYQGGQTHGSIMGHNLTVSNTDGDGFNPCSTWHRDGQGGRAQIDNFTALYCYQALEGWLGEGGWLRGEIHNCNVGGMIQGGRAGTLGYSIYSAPTRINAAIIPYSCLDLIIRNSGTMYLGSFLKSAYIRTSDTKISIGGNSVFDDGVIDSQFDMIEVLADQGNMATGISMYAGDPAGTDMMRDVRVRYARVGRTSNARANGYTVDKALVYYPGPWGPNVVIERLRQECNFPASPTASPGTAPTAFIPVVREVINDKATTSSAAVEWNVQTTATIVPTAPVMKLQRTASGTSYAFTLSTSATNVQAGQTLELVNEQSDTVYVLNTAGTRNKTTIAIGLNQRIRLQFDGSAWRTLEAPAPHSGTAVIDVAAIAANGVSAEQTITLLGARTDMLVRVIPPVAVAASAAVEGAYVSANDTVKFRLRDLTGAGYDPPSGTYTAYLGAN